MPAPLLSARALIAALAILGAALPQAESSPGDTARAFAAGCRIRTATALGTGTAFARDSQNVYVLTCAHVIDQHQECTCEFWCGGHVSSELPGRVIFAQTVEAIDAAVIAVPLSAFGGVLPVTIPLGTASEVDAALQPGATIYTAGCPEGNWISCVQGHVDSVGNGELRFVPPPREGRSGSALLDSTGTRIVGLLKARTVPQSQGEAMVGIATPGRVLRQSLTGSTPMACTVQLAQYAVQVPYTGTGCGPGGCDSGGCSPYGPSRGGQPVFPNAPWNRSQPQRPWGSLPPGIVPAEPAPEPDTEPVPIPRPRRLPDVDIDVTPMAPIPPLTVAPSSRPTHLFWLPICCCVTVFAVRRLVCVLLTVIRGARHV